MRISDAVYCDHKGTATVTYARVFYPREPSMILRIVLPILLALPGAASYVHAEPEQRQFCQSDETSEGSETEEEEEPDCD